MLTLPLTRPIVINDVPLNPGTEVQASYNEKSGLTHIFVPGVGSRDFLTAPVRFL